MFGLENVTRAQEWGKQDPTRALVVQFGADGSAIVALWQRAQVSGQQVSAGAGATLQDALKEALQKADIAK